MAGKSGSHVSCPPHSQERPLPHRWLAPPPRPQRAGDRSEGQAGAPPGLSDLGPTTHWFTTPNLSFCICGTGLGHEDKVGFSSDHSAKTPFPSCPSGPAPPMLQDSRTTRPEGRLCPSSATSRKEGGRGRGARGPRRGLGPEGNGWLQDTDTSHLPLTYNGQRPRKLRPRSGASPCQALPSRGETSQSAKASRATSGSCRTSRMARCNSWALSEGRLSTARGTTVSSARYTSTSAAAMEVRWCQRGPLPRHKHATQAPPVPNWDRGPTHNLLG